MRGGFNDVFYIAEINIEIIKPESNTDLISVVDSNQKNIKNPINLLKEERNSFPDVRTHSCRTLFGLSSLENY